MKGPRLARLLFRPTRVETGAPLSVRSRLMEEDREGEPAGPAADWSDYAMAAVMIGISLLVFLFR